MKREKTNDFNKKEGVPVKEHPKSTAETRERRKAQAIERAQNLMFWEAVTEQFRDRYCQNVPRTCPQDRAISVQPCSDDVPSPSSSGDAT